MFKVKCYAHKASQFHLTQPYDRSTKSVMKIYQPWQKLLAYPLLFSINIIMMIIIIIYLPVKKKILHAGWRFARLPIASELRIAVL